MADKSNFLDRQMSPLPRINQDPDGERARDALKRLGGQLERGIGFPHKIIVESTPLRPVVIGFDWARPDPVSKR